MKVQSQKIPTPRGCLVGYKAVSRRRRPIFQGGRGSPHYEVGTTHVAGNRGGPVLLDCSSASTLRAGRNKYSTRSCLPGIHLCLDVMEAESWMIGDQPEGKIIPVAYSPCSVVGNKVRGVVVVYRIKVLG